jgi:hypothetical protein
MDTMSYKDRIEALKSRDAAIRIDENENWLRFVGAAWDAEPVTAHDLHKRNKELRRESGQAHPLYCDKCGKRHGILVECRESDLSGSKPALD